MIESPDRHKTFLVFGAPGSGKGTIGQALGAIPRFFHQACGEVFRTLDTRTALGQEFIRYSSQGKLVPDELTVQMWKSSIDDEVRTHRFKPDIDFLVLDGIPRSVRQAELMDSHIDVLQVFHLSCPDREELRRRLRKRALKDNRFDDASNEVIARRIQTYERDSKPMLEYYHKHLIMEINAVQSPVKVLCDILTRISNRPDWMDHMREGALA
ncbi:MAG: nucleoside monophosphate kinase [Verrucomicrobiales bacterium]